MPTGQRRILGAQHPENLVYDNSEKGSKLLPVHDSTSNQCQTEKCWTGVLEHLDLPVVDDKEDGDNAGDGTEEGDREKDESDWPTVLCQTGGVISAGVTSSWTWQAHVQH